MANRGMKGPIVIGKFQLPGDPFDAIDPMDYRYWSSEMAQYWSENAMTRYKLAFESALIATFEQYGICPSGVADQVLCATREVRTIEVYRGEDKTGHDIDGLTLAIKRKLAVEARRFVHLGTTSYDTIGSAEALRHKEGTLEGVIPLLKGLLAGLVCCSLSYADLAQMGRSHLRHAVPITLGFWAANHAQRIGSAIVELEKRAQELCGKASGPTGTSNAFSTFIDDPIEFERDVMDKLGLCPAPISTQIVPPEPMFRLYCAFTEAAMAISNIGDDIRHLAMTEVGEVFEPKRTKGITTGSSAMPHKSLKGGNPVVSENAYGSARIFGPMLASVALNSVSELARDLGNSMPPRFHVIVPALLMYEAKRVGRVMGKLVVDKENIQRHLEEGARFVGAEPLYIHLALLGHPNAHNCVAKLCLEAQANGMSLVDVFSKKRSLKGYRERMQPELLDIVANPIRYTGVARERTLQIANYWKDRFKIEV